jgi:hypothetical protein
MKTIANRGRWIDAHTSHRPESGVTLNERISIAVIDQLISRNQLTGLSVATLAGVPEVYDVRTRARRHAYC